MSVFLKYVKSSEMYENIKRGPMKEEGQYRTERIYIRMTKEEKEMLEIFAKLQHKTKSEFIRDLIFNKYFDDFIKIAR
ncbi:MAG: DUF6290 family protein [Sarcina sp.]